MDIALQLKQVGLIIDELYPKVITGIILSYANFGVDITPLKGCNKYSKLSLPFEISTSISNLFVDGKPQYYTEMFCKTSKSLHDKMVLWIDDVCQQLSNILHQQYKRTVATGTLSLGQVGDIFTKCNTELQIGDVVMLGTLKVDYFSVADRDLYDSSETMFINVCWTVDVKRALKLCVGAQAHKLVPENKLQQQYIKAFVDVNKHIYHREFSGDEIGIKTVGCQQCSRVNTVGVNKCKCHPQYNFCGVNDCISVYHTNIPPQDIYNNVLLHNPTLGLYVDIYNA